MYVISMYVRLHVCVYIYVCLYRSVRIRKVLEAQSRYFGSGQCYVTIGVTDRV
jgi:hypothetical protein